MNLQKDIDTLIAVEEGRKSSLPHPLTKEQELILLEAVILSLPNGYLKEILQQERPHIESAIKSDISFLALDETLRDLRKESSDLKVQIEDQKRTVSELLAEAERQRRLLVTMQIQHNDAKTGLAQARAIAKDILGLDQCS